MSSLFLAYLFIFSLALIVFLHHFLHLINRYHSIPSIFPTYFIWFYHEILSIFRTHFFMFSFYHSIINFPSLFLRFVIRFHPFSILFLSLDLISCSINFSLSGHLVIFRLSGFLWRPSACRKPTPLNSPWAVS